MAAKRFSRNDWLQLGLSRLARGGPSALTIEELCAQANKTRGSFYFHFENVEAFLVELAEHWQESYTQALIEGAIPTTDRNDKLNLLVGRLDLALESGIRQLAVVNNAVGEIVREADSQRVDWLGSLYAQGKSWDPQEAKNLAKIEYAAFTGFRLIDPDLSPADARKLYEAFLKFTART